MTKSKKQFTPAEVARNFIKDGVYASEPPVRLTVALAKEVISHLCLWLRQAHKERRAVKDYCHRKVKTLRKEKWELFDQLGDCRRKLNGFVAAFEAERERNRELLMCKKEDVQALEERLQRAADMADELAMKNQHLRDQVEQLEALL